MVGSGRIGKGEGSTSVTCRLGKNWMALALSFSPLMAPCACGCEDDGGLVLAPVLVLRVMVKAIVRCLSVILERVYIS